jgi:hypothetical protein
MSMTLRGFGTGLLFCAGMAGGLLSGHLFYLERYVPGGAMLVLTAVFLFYALGDPIRALGEEKGEDGLEALRDAVTRLALLVADDAVDGAKRIGRTMPCTPAEIDRLEDALTAIFSALHVGRESKDRTLQELNKLRTLSRQNEGRRVLRNRKP